MSGGRSQTWQSGFGRIPEPPRRTRRPSEEPGEDAAGITGPADVAGGGTAEAHGGAVGGNSDVAPGRAPGVSTQISGRTGGRQLQVVTPSAPARPSTSEPPSPSLSASAGAGVGHGDLPRTLPRPSSTPPTGRAVTGAQVRASRAASRHASAVVTALGQVSVSVRAVEAELAADRLHLVLAPQTGTVDDILDNADVIADGLTVEDVTCTSDGQRVHVWAAVGTSSGTRQVAFWVPLAVREAVNAARQASGQPATTVVLSAFNRVAGEDGSGLDDLFDGPSAPVTGPMDVGPRRRRANIDTPVQLWLYLSMSQEATLDQAVARTGAGSRSALLTRVLEHDFGLPVTGP